MKKITLLTLLFVSALGFSQQTETQLSDVDPTTYAQNQAAAQAAVVANRGVASTELKKSNYVEVQRQQQTRLENGSSNALMSGFFSYTEYIGSTSSFQAPVTLGSRQSMIINSSQNSVVTAYTDPALFAADCGGTLTMEDFSGGPAAITTCGPLISSAGDGCFPPAELEDGFAISSVGAGTQETVFIPIDALGAGVPGVDLVGSNSFGDFTVLTFNGPDDVFAVSMQLFNFQDVDTDVRVFDQGGVLLDMFTINNPIATDNFVGVISVGDAIGSIEMEGLNGSGELFGVLAFGDCGGGTGGTCGGTLANYLNVAPTGNGVPSQDFAAANDAFDSQAADDFIVPGAGMASVCEVTITGTYTATGLPTDPGNMVVMNIHEDNAGEPGTIIFTESFLGTDVDADGDAIFTLSPTGAPDLMGGSKYWMSVITQMEFAVSGQFFWSSATDGNDDPFLWQNPLDGFATGCTTWQTSAVCGVGGGLGPDLLMDIAFLEAGGGPPSGCTAGVYTDRASFDAEAGTLVDEDLAGGPGGISACGEVISAAGDTCYAPGEIQAGIEITMNSPGVNTTVFVEAGNFGLTDDAVGSNTFVDYTIINFPGNDVNSFAFDLYGLTAGATMDIRIFGVGGLIATETVTDTGAGGGVFFGYIAAETVVSVEIEDLTGAAAELIAQISFGECVNAPPPPTCNLATYDATGLPADIDPGATSTSDCVAAPNLYPVTVGDAGTIGAGANIDNVTINITHTFDGDLDISLVSPLGTELLLSGGNGGGGDNFTNTVFMDGAGPLSGGAPPYTGTFAPDGGTFAATFDGEDITGDWSLKICDNFGGDTGTVDSFSITICIPPTNDECEFAYPIACGDVYVGSTLPDTDSGSNPAPDEFFTYTGSGSAEIVTLSLCDGGTDYDSFLRVFSDCTLANEIAANDDSCGLQSELSFLSDGTSTYVIMVEGFASSAGNFSLAVTCTDVAVNDECDDALPMACGDIVSGSTVNATFDAAAPVCTTAITAPGVWYVYEDTTGLVTDITLTMCNGTTDYDSKITVYTGDCGALVCETDNDDTCGLQSEVMFQSNGNETFYILVHGFGGATGNFELEMICAPIPPPNDMIANSIDVDEIGFPYTDPAVAMPAATTEAGGTPAGCDNAGVKGVWYNFVPEGDGTATAEIITPGPEGLEFSVNNGPLAGTYTAVAADFGGAFTSTPLTEDTAVVVDDGTSGDPNDACDPIQNGPSLVGKVAIVRRGACEFGVKALAAENEGAIAVIVVNNAPGDPIVMGGGAQGGNVTIPVLMVTDVDGEAIIAEVSGGGTVNVTMVLTPASFSSVTFYTAPNEMAVETDLTLVPWVFNQCVPGIEASINTVAGQAYYVYVANHGSITDIVIDGTNLGVTDNETIEGFSYYPNPADSTINLTSIDTIENVVIYNMLGQVVLNQNVGATISQLNVSNLATGAYIMKATVNGQTGTYKIIKR